MMHVVSLNRCQAVAAAVILQLTTATTYAQSPDWTRMASEYAADRPGSPTAAELIELVELHERLKTPENAAANDAFTRQLIWWWAAARQVDAATATQELLEAYAANRGDVPGEFRELLKLSLAGLPQPGRDVYMPPPHVARGPLVKLPSPFRLGRRRPLDLLGQNEKQGITQISSGIRP